MPALLLLSPGSAEILSALVTEIMAAKFVNLVEFFELKIGLKIEMVGFIDGGMNGDGRIIGFQLRNIRPQQEFLVGKGRDSNTGMMDAEPFGAEFPFAIKKVHVANRNGQVDRAGQPGTMHKRFDGNSEEKNTFHGSEKKIKPWHLAQCLSSQESQYQNISRYQQQAGEVNFAGVGLPEMREGMNNNQPCGHNMQ